MKKIIATFKDCTMEFDWDGKEDRFKVLRRNCRRLGIAPFAIIS